MRLYALYDASENKVNWHPTQDAARADLNLRTDPLFRPQMVVALCEIPTDKAGLLALLNGQLKEDAVLTRWHGTKGGGLKEFGLEEAPKPVPEEVLDTRSSQQKADAFWAALTKGQGK